jgi:hypothetical protein
MEDDKRYYQVASAHSSVNMPLCTKNAIPSPLRVEHLVVIAGISVACLRQAYC